MSEPREMTQAEADATPFGSIRRQVKAMRPRLNAPDGAPGSWRAGVLHIVREVELRAEAATPPCPPGPHPESVDWHRGYEAARNELATPAADLRAAIEKAIDLTAQSMRRGDEYPDHPKSHARESIIRAALGEQVKP